jgi:DNA-directed RNA polymerase beta' subunit
MDSAYMALRPKSTVVDDACGRKRISHVQFGVFGASEVTRVSEFEVVSDKGYEQPSRTPVVGGVLDRRLGVSDKQSTCETCGCKLQDCPGHYGHIKLVLPVFHLGYLKPMIAVLQCICKTCSRALVPPVERARTIKQMAHPLVAHDHVRKMAAVKRVVERCKKMRECPHCGALNGLVKKVGSMRVVHEKFKEKDRGERADVARREFHGSFDMATAAGRGAFESAQTAGSDLKALLPKAQDDLNPLRVKALLEAIPECDLPLLDMSACFGRPENLLVENLLVPPVPIRPSVVTDAASGSNEDDLTVKLSDIICVNNIIRNALGGGKALVPYVTEDWEYLQLQCAMYLNGANVPNVRPEWHAEKRVIRAFAQRLKGKQGRFRGNLSGKRVDFSGRTVISPDPNLAIDQVCVPIHVAKVLTYPQRVFAHNLSNLRQVRPRPGTRRACVCAPHACAPRACAVAPPPCASLLVQPPSLRLLLSRTMAVWACALSAHLAARPQRTGRVAGRQLCRVGRRRGQHRQLRCCPQEIAQVRIRNSVAAPSPANSFACRSGHRCPCAVCGVPRRPPYAAAQRRRTLDVRVRRYGDRRRTASELKVGDVVERHLSDGDVVLFNRQPSLHKLSIMAHRARVMPGRTFRFNECVCAPYNADFDGDEMNLHLPQTEEARAESLALLGVLSNLVTPRNGEIVVSATQDFLTGAYLLSRKSVFLTRDQFRCVPTHTHLRTLTDRPPHTRDQCARAHATRRDGAAGGGGAAPHARCRACRPPPCVRSDADPLSHCALARQPIRRAYGRCRRSDRVAAASDHQAGGDVDGQAALLADAAPHLALDAPRQPRRAQQKVQHGARQARAHPHVPRRRLGLLPGLGAHLRDDRQGYCWRRL